MSRPIKFRQPMWDKRNKFAGWHYWGFIDDGFSEPVWSPESSVKEARQQSQQFTGLHAKNGKEIKEIYEGDIVHFVDPKNYSRPKVFKSVIKWFQEGCSWECAEIKGNKSWGLHKFNTNRIEVIGNIYENPELLEDKK